MTVCMQSVQLVPQSTTQASHHNTPQLQCTDPSTLTTQHQALQQLQPCQPCTPEHIRAAEVQACKPRQACPELLTKQQRAVNTLQVLQAAKQEAAADADAACGGCGSGAAGSSGGNNLLLCGSCWCCCGCIAIMLLLLVRLRGCPALQQQQQCLASFGEACCTAAADASRSACKHEGEDAVPCNSPASAAYTARRTCC